MAKEKLHEMKQTTNSFQVRGIVSGTKSQRFYRSGVSDNGSKWNGLEFGVKISENKFIYITLNGFSRPEVFYYKKGENGGKGHTQRVAWQERKNVPAEGYRLIGITISTGKDQNNKNINDVFTEYDAVEYLHENLHDGESVFIKGNLNFSSYTAKNGETRRKIEMIPTQISYTQNPVDFNAEDYTEMCEFENTLVFSSIEKEMDEKNKPTDRYILNGWSVGYNNIETVSFIIDKDHAKLANNIRKAMKSGYSIKTYGRVEVINNITPVETDDGWGETSIMERVNTPVRREYVVYRADPTSIEKEEYSENEIAAAIRKIKASKEAETNFGDKNNTNTNDVFSDDWGDDGFGDEEAPWA